MRDWVVQTINKNTSFRDRGDVNQATYYFCDLELVFSMIRDSVFSSAKPGMKVTLGGFRGCHKNIPGQPFKTAPGT